ncbi:hypothetical protein [Streptomyces griseoluteus]
MRRMQEAGELRPEADVTELADLTVAAIPGGLLLAQVVRHAMNQNLMRF